MLKSWLLIPGFLLRGTNRSLWLCEDPGTCNKDKELTDVSGVRNHTQKSENSDDDNRIYGDFLVQPVAACMHKDSRSKRNPFLFLHKFY